MLTIKDFSTALYALSKAKGYAVTVIVTLGVTLGALVAMFNLNYQTLAAPLPYQDEDKLMVGQTPYYNKDGLVFGDVLSVRFATEIYKQQQTNLESFALVGYSIDDIVLRDLADTPKINIAYTTPEYMQLLQMPLLHGRAFEATDGLDQHSAVAVLSEHLWRQHYAAAPDMIGKTIRIGATDFKVVGIAAASFEEPRLNGPNRSNDLWLPWDFNPRYERNAQPAALNGWHFMLGKLTNSADKAALEQQMSALFNEKFQNGIVGNPTYAGNYLTFRATPIRTKILGDSRQRTLWMFAGALVLLLIASVNLINLTLSRAIRQQRELAIKAALGAQKKHVFTYVLTELSVLMLGAMLLSLLVAQAGYALLTQVTAEFLPRVTELGLNMPSLIFALTTTTLLALVFTRLIIRQVNYRTLNSSLQSSGKGSGLQVSKFSRQILIASQISLTAILLIGSAQLLQQSLTELGKDVGFELASTYQLAIDEIRPEMAPEQRLSMMDTRKRELSDIRDLLQQHPAVEQASFANNAPISYNGRWEAGAWLTSVELAHDPIRTLATLTDQHFIPLFGLKLLSGRNFTPQEVENNSPVLVLNESMAKKLQPDGQVLGQRLFLRDGTEFEIIGVVNDYQLANSEAELRTFIPRAPRFGVTIILKLKPGMTTNTREINQLMMQASPRYRVAGIHSIKDNVMKHLFSDHLAAGVTTALIILTLFLAFTGIYGVLSYSVQLRRFELGVRMALGARPATILRQLLGENLKPVCAGLILAALLLVALWLGLQQTTFMVELSAGGFALPLALIVLLTTLTSLLSVWGIIRKPTIYALQGQ